ncbi:MAG: (2Fe-2S)-binding protein [Vescimonas sp.]
MEDVLICRCEEIYKSEILTAIRAGARTANEVKRFTNAGMGLCQGRTCRKLIEAIIAQETGAAPETVQPARYRMPARPVCIAQTAGERKEDAE